MHVWRLLTRNKEGSINALGQRSFRTSPRFGEHIPTDDSSGNGTVWKVVDVFHGVEGAKEDGDLYLARVGTAREWDQLASV